MMAAARAEPKNPQGQTRGFVSQGAEGGQQSGPQKQQGQIFHEQPHNHLKGKEKNSPEQTMSAPIHDAAYQKQPYQK